MGPGEQGWVDVCALCRTFFCFCFSRYGLFTSCCRHRHDPPPKDPHRSALTRPPPTYQAVLQKQPGAALRLRLSLLNVVCFDGRTQTAESFSLSSAVRMYWSVSSSSITMPGSSTDDDHSG